MRISVKSVSHELLINTVLLSKNLVDPLNVYLFRCYKCATSIKQIQGLVTAIYAGYLPSQDVATIDRCANCSENYTFQTSHKKSPMTKLSLSANTLTTFHCVNCRTPLLQYNMSGAVRLPEYVKLKEPAFDCTLNSCPMRYALHEIVEPVVA